MTSSGGSYAVDAPVLPEEEEEFFRGEPDHTVAALQQQTVLPRPTSSEDKDEFSLNLSYVPGVRKTHDTSAPSLGLMIEETTASRRSMAAEKSRSITSEWEKGKGTSFDSYGGSALPLDTDYPRDVAEFIQWKARQSKRPAFLAQE